MKGSRNQDQLFEEKEEVQKEMLQLDEEAQMKSEREQVDQCRSCFSMACYKLNNEKEL